MPAPIARGSQSLLSGKGLHGHLELICAAEQGRSYLRHQGFRVPMHLSKPHLDEGGVLVLNIVNPTAGLLAGDFIRIDVQVERGAQLLLSTPSACRVHKMREGFAEVNQSYRVAQDAHLEIWPELFIPQGGARYRQRTELRVEEGGQLLFFEILAPGRVAAGEAFAYDWLEWSTDLFLGIKPIARERYRLTPDDESLEPMRTQFAHAYYASCFVVSSQLDSQAACWKAIHALHCEEAWVGWSSLGRGAWAVKVVANGSIALRRTLGQIRQLLHEALNRSLPALRRI